MSLVTPFFTKGSARQNSRCLIFVEGQDDAVFLSSLLAEIGADPSKTGIVEVQGKENFPSRLKTFMKSPNFTQGLTRTIAIICDADGNPKSVEANINAVLTLAQQPAAVPGSYVTNGNGVKIGLFTCLIHQHPVIWKAFVWKPLHVIRWKRALKFLWQLPKNCCKE